MRLLLLLYSTFLFLSICAPSSTAQRIISVHPQGASIQAEIDKAQAGDILELQPGRYEQANIRITKALTIRGGNDAIIDGQGRGFVLVVQSDSVQLYGFSLHGSGSSFIEDYAALLVEDVRHIRIEGLHLRENFFGIYLAKAQDVVIRGNTIQASNDRETQSGNGIHMWYSRDILIEKNTVFGHRDGLYFEFVEDVIARENISRNNLRYGLHFMFSDRCLYQKNQIRDNGAGVAVMYTKNVDMLENEFRDNWGSASYGVLLKEINNSRIENNSFYNNSVGLYLEASSYNRIQNNLFDQNGWAIKIMANSIENEFKHNNFTLNTFEVSTNSSRSFNLFEANYWSTYSGYDLDRDGVGDVPHHPVRLFSVLVERVPQSLVLLNSLMVEILDQTERLLPALTPAQLIDKKPQMGFIQ